METASLVAIIGPIIAAGSLVVASASYTLNRRNAREQEAKRSEEVFDRARREVKGNHADLQARVQDLIQGHFFRRGVPLLSKEGWIPEHPLRLEQITMRWHPPRDGEERARREFDGAREQTAPYWPRYPTVRETYHDTIERLEKPAPHLFFNGSAYRLLGVEVPDPAGVTLHFGPGRYFDALDTTDVLGYEVALMATTPRRGRARRSGKGNADILKGPYRTWLRDPFAFDRRCAIPGICTVTIRRGDGGAQFVLHERNAAKVALAQGITHVTPAGEFQPKDMSSQASVHDLNILNNIIREYAEEFLGLEQAQGQPIDTLWDERFQEVTRKLRRAHDDGEMIVRFLGIGLDPLTWKPEILTAAVFSEQTFDDVFSEIVHENEEGRLIFSDDRVRAGIDFTLENVDHRAGGQMLTAGQACLRLAWLHRVELGLS